MEAYLKRYFWTLKLGLLSLVAYSASGVVNHHLMTQAVKALEGMIPSSSAKVKAKPVTLEQRPSWSSSIGERNLFNANPPSAAEESAKSAQGPEEPAEPKNALPEPYEDCEDSKQSVTLKLTMVAEPSTSSYAVIQHDGEDRIILEGDTFEDFKVVAIQWNGEGGRVVLNEDGSYKCLALGKKNGRATPNYKRSSAPKKRVSKRSGQNQKYKDGIKEISPGRYEVDRAMLDEQIANLDSIMNQARVIPHYRQGKPVGFKVVGIRSNSIFRHLGLKSGDVLKSVGGEELTSINKALGLFEKLKTSDNVSIDVERLGKGQTLDYTIK